VNQSFRANVGQKGGGGGGERNTSEGLKKVAPPVMSGVREVKKKARPAHADVLCKGKEQKL